MAKILTVKDIKWSKFYSFSEVYEYHGVFCEDHNQLTRQRNKKSFNGVDGIPHSDGGFRLRSENTCRKSFDKVPLKIPLSTLPCPLNKGDIGLYFIRIQINRNKWDYIGRSYEEHKGIMDRLRDHFTKIAGTNLTNYGQDTVKFSELKDELFKNEGINTNTAEFFNKYVKIAFLKTDKTEIDRNEKNAKLEDMAFAFYIGVTGDIPKLNKTKEVRGLEGLNFLIEQ